MSDFLLSNLFTEAVDPSMTEDDMHKELSKLCCANDFMLLLISQQLPDFFVEADNG